MNHKYAVPKQSLSIILACMMLVGTMLTWFPQVGVKAASESGTVSYSYISGYSFDFSGLGLPCGSFKGQASMIKTNGKPTYCIEIGVSIKSGSYTFHDYYNRFSDDQKNLLRYALIYGYTGNTKYGYSESIEYWATQIVCWQIENDSYHDSSMSNRIMEAAISTDKAAIRDVVGKIREQINEHESIPSFMTGMYVTPIAEYELSRDSNGKYSVTLTDTNNVAQYYDWSSFQKSGIEVTVSSNKVTFTSNDAIPTPKAFAASKMKSKYLDNITDVAPLYLSSSSSQDLVYDFGGNIDPVPAYIRLKTSLGHINIVKRADDGKVSGLKFRIQGDGVDQTVTTGSDGTILVQNLAPGKYTVTETSTPSRYVQPQSQTITVESGKTTQVTFSNVLKKVQMNVTKTDKETGTAQGDASLDGAQYGMYNASNDKLIDPYVTAGGGKFQTKVYNCADLPERVYFQEIAPSEGYLLDTTKYYVDVAPGNFTVELNPVNKGVVEQVKKGDLKFIKMTDLPDPNGNGSEQIKAPEADAKFHVYLKSAGSYDKAKPSERNILTTDEYGYAEWLGIPYGTYHVEQIEGTEGHAFIPSFDVVVSEDGKTYFYLLENPIHRARVKIAKKDAETGKTIPVSGTGFQILDKDKKVITQTVYYPTEVVLNTFYTDEHGELMLPEMLVYGDYYLKEVQAPDGYVLSKELLPFSLKDESADTVTVEFHNIPQKGSITIQKDGDVPVGTGEKDGLTAPVFDLQGLAGAEFTVTAVGDIVTPDGTVRNKDGEVVGTLVTGEDGTAKLEGLYLGTYDVQETKAPEGFVLNDTVQRVTLSYAGQEVEVLDTVHVGITNERQEALIQLIKALETDELTGTGMKDEWRDVKFGLYAAEDIYYPGTAPTEPDENNQADPDEEETDEESEEPVPDDNILIPAGTLLQTSGIDAEGRGAFTVRLAGEYKLKEIATNDKYLISDKEYPVSFAYPGQEVPVVELFANEKEAIHNRLKRGDVEITKTDVSDGEPLPNTGIEILDKDLNTVVQGRTDEEGVVTFPQLPAGEYYFREFDAPEGYLIDDTLYPFSISEDGEIVKCSMTNERILGSVQVRKVDRGDERILLSGAEFKLYRDVDGDGTLSDGDELVGTLTELEAGSYGMDNLWAGDYLVQETKAPKGYDRDETVHAFRITKDEHGSIVTLTITNQKRAELPKTGDEGTPWWIVFLSSFALTGFIAVSVRKRRSAKEICKEDLPEKHQ